VRRAARALLPLLALLGGCVDFVDPSGLRLAQATRFGLSIQIADRGGFTNCQGAVVTATTAVVCIQASVRVGADQFGERLPVLNDTMRLMGSPLTPTLAPDSTLNYELVTTLPVALLDDTVIVVGFPRVQGAESLPELRWVAVGRSEPDSLSRLAGEGVRLSVDLPRGTATPRPQSRFWTLDLSGTRPEVSELSYRGTGIPQPSYSFPAEGLQTLGNDRFFAALRWFQQSPAFTPPPGVQLNVLFDQQLTWRVTTRAR